MRARFAGRMAGQQAGHRNRQPADDIRAEAGNSLVSYDPTNRIASTLAGGLSCSPSPGELSPALNRCIRVLVVEDDLAACEALSKVLSQAGYEAVFAADGQDALQHIEQRPIDLLILNLGPPNKCEWDTFEQIKRKHPLLPIITTA